jgi:hydrogenase small subunit
MSQTVEIPVVWLQGAACSGCVVSLLNSFSPGASSIVLRELAAGKHLSLRFLATAMAGQGQQVLDVLEDETVRDSGKYVLVMDGSLPTGNDLYASLGEKDGREPSGR